MTPDWSPLDRALEAWGDSPLPLWWRDDDAVEPTPALERLGEMSQSTGLPVHLAIIPAGATRALGERIAGDDRFLPLVHGWAHENHEHEGKKSEFGAARPLEVRQGQAAQAFVRLEQALGHPPLPVFVPPWNRIADDMAPALAGAGYRALSTFTPREAPMAAEGLHRINTHLDPIDWKGTRGLADPDRLIRQVAADLDDRREGRIDAAEPYGILTHHLVHDDALWEFTGALIGRLLSGPATPWRADRDLEDEA